MPWQVKEFFTGSSYHTNTLEAYAPKPETEIPSAGKLCPLQVSTLVGGLARMQKANIEHAKSFSVFPHLAAPSTSIPANHMGCGWNYNKCKVPSLGGGVVRNRINLLPRLLPPSPRLLPLTHLRTARYLSRALRTPPNERWEVLRFSSPYP